MLSAGAFELMLAVDDQTQRVDFCDGECDEIWRVAETSMEPMATDVESASRWTSILSDAVDKSRTSSSAGRC
jgi:hypothetical protein